MWLIRKLVLKSLICICCFLSVAAFCPRQEALAWSYVVQKGDTIDSVAALTRASATDLRAANKLSGESLVAGTVLEIPDFISTSSILEFDINMDLTNPTSTEPVISYSEEELDLLARCIFAEAGGRHYEGQVAVAAVVVNRVQNASFPDTITEVIYAPKQFECVTNGMIENIPPQSCYDAALAALHGADNTYGALYFWAPSLVYSAFHESLSYLCTIDCHIFATDQ